MELGGEVLIARPTRGNVGSLEPLPNDPPWFKKKRNLADIQVVN